jgi:hypothetical protein
VDDFKWFKSKQFTCMSADDSFECFRGEFVENRFTLINYHVQSDTRLVNTISFHDFADELRINGLHFDKSVGIKFVTIKKNEKEMKIVNWYPGSMMVRLNGTSLRGGSRE